MVTLKYEDQKSFTRDYKEDTISLYTPLLCRSLIQWPLPDIGFHYIQKRRKSPAIVTQKRVSPKE